MPVSVQSYRSLLDCENIYTQPFVNEIAPALSEGSENIYTQQFVNKIASDLSEYPVLVHGQSPLHNQGHHKDNGGHEREQSAISLWSISRGAVSPCLPLQSSDKVDCGRCCLFILLLSFCLETGARSPQSIISKHLLLILSCLELRHCGHVGCNWIPVSTRS